jgi:aconitate hydratase
LGLDGTEHFDIDGVLELGDETRPIPRELRVKATRSGHDVEFMARLRIDTPGEAAYFRHGGILPYVLRNLARSAGAPG